MKKIFSYVTSVVIIVCASMLIIYGLFNGFKIFPIIIGAVIGYLGLLIPVAYKNQAAMEKFKDNLVIINSYVAGVTFRQDNVQQAYEEYLKDKELVVDLVPDPDNEFNSDAVKVLINNIHVGYIPNRDLKKYYSYLNLYDYVDSNVDFKVKKDIFIDLTIYFKK